MNGRGIGYLLVAVAAAGWGMWPLILRHVVMPASLQAALLMVAMTVLSVPFMARDRVRQRASLVHWLAIGWVAVADALNILLFFAAYQRTSVAIAVLTHYFTPVFVALAAPFALRERMQARTVTAVAISFVGLALLLEPWRQGFSSGDLAGAALGAGSAVFYASNVIANKRLAHVFSASELMFFHGVLAVPLLWAMVPGGALAAASWTSLVILFFGALGPGVLCGLMFVWGLRRIAASHASVLTLLEPFVAVVLAAVFLGQALGGAQVVGGVFIALGAILVILAKPHTDVAPEIE